MKAAIAVVLVVALVASSLPLAAQEARSVGAARPETPAPTVATAVTRAVGRLAPKTGGRVEYFSAEWAKIRKIEQGRRVKVTVRGGDLIDGRFLGADDVELGVLVLVSGLSGRFRAQVEEMSKTFDWERRGAWSETSPDGVRMTLKGVFSASGEKLADVRMVAKADVVSVDDGRVSKAGRVLLGIGIGIGAFVAFGALLFGTA